MKAIGFITRSRAFLGRRKSRSRVSTTMRLACGLFALACSDADPTIEPLGEVEEHIVGGLEADEMEIHSTVAILTTDKTNESQYCTGTVIDSNYVLTAAHCVDDVAKYWFAYPKVWVKENTLTRFMDPGGKQGLSGPGGNKQGLTSPGVSNKDIVHQAANYYKHDHLDVAVIRIVPQVEWPWSGTKLSQKYALVPTKRVNQQGWQNKAHLISGFGRQKQNEPATGRLKIGVGRTRPAENEDKNAPDVVSIGGPAYACSGDSGGPAYQISDAGNIYVVAVDSGQPRDAKPAKGKDPCAVKDDYSWVPSFEPWLNDHFSIHHFHQTSSPKPSK